MARALNSAITMKWGIAVTAALLVAACRGQKVPRDYQNAPPAMTHPATTSSQTPTANGMPAAAPEPTTGVEGQTTKPVSPIPPTPTKLPDQAPSATDTATQTNPAATTTTRSVATGTHLATPP